MIFAGGHLDGMGFEQAAFCGARVKDEVENKCGLKKYSLSIGFSSGHQQQADFEFHPLTHSK